MPAETIDREPVRWEKDSIPLVVTHDAEDLTPAQSAAAVAEVFAAWNAFSPVRVEQVTHSTTTNRLRYSDDERYFGPGVVAVTVLSYSSSGKAKGGSILLNQTEGRSFCFSANKNAASCGTGGWGLNPLYVGDVLSHEVGHLLGLAHSEVRDSSMVYLAMLGQHTPHADDMAGLRTLYGQSGWGSIRGVVRGGNSVPVFGAHVQAISASTGAVAGAAVSATDGTFVVGGLPPGHTYYLYVEPLRKVSVLTDPLASVQNDFCPGPWVGSFFETCGSAGKGHPQPVRVPSASIRDVGTVTIRCHLRVGEEYLLDKASLSGGTYSFTATPSKPGEAFVGVYPASTTLPTSFSLSTGHDDGLELDLSALAVPAGNPRLEIRLLTTGIGSALDFSVEIDGPHGTLTDPDRAVVAPFASPNLESGTFKPLFERRLLYPLHATAGLNVFSVRLKPRALTLLESSVALPSDAAFTLSDRPWLALVSIVSDVGAGDYLHYQNRVPTLSDNRTCLDAAYTRTVQANTVPASAINGGDDEAATQSASPACGSWEPPSSGGPGMGWPLLIGFLAALAALPRRRRL